MGIRLKVGTAVAALAVAAAATAAVAEWSSTATGTGSAQSTHDSPSHITASVFAPDLFPGATDSVSVTLDNPNPYPVIVTSISSGSSGAQGNCTAGTVTSDAVNGSPAVVQADGSTTTIAAAGSGTYQLTTHMVGGADNSCQGLSFSLALTAGLQSAAG